MSQQTVLMKAAGPQDGGTLAPPKGAPDKGRPTGGGELPSCDGCFGRSVRTSEREKLNRINEPLTTKVGEKSEKRSFDKTYAAAVSIQKFMTYVLRRRHNLRRGLLVRACRHARMALRL